jgi:hypothetical protein
MGSLKVLKLNHNRIKSFAFLNEPSEPSSSVYLGLSELEELEIAYNCIDTANGLMGIARLPKLKQVALAGNAVLKDSSTVQLKDDDICNFHFIHFLKYWAPLNWILSVY